MRLGLVIALAASGACGALGACDGAPDAATTRPDAGPGAGDAAPPDGDAGPVVGEVVLTQRTIVTSEASTTEPHQWTAFYLPERPMYQHLVEREGACELWRFEVAQCAEACDGICVEPGRCVAFEWSEAGDITVVGGARAVLRTTGGWYQFAEEPPASLMLSDTVAITASGGEVGAFALELPMPAPLDVQLRAPVVLDDATGLHVTWTPEVGGSARVRLEILSSDPFHGSVRSAILRCEVADAAGELVLPGRLLAQFPALEDVTFGLCPGAECPPSTLARLHTTRLATPQGIVEVVVGHGFAFWPVHEGTP